MQLNNWDSHCNLCSLVAAAQKWSWNFPKNSPSLIVSLGIHRNLRALDKLLKNRKCWLFSSSTHLMRTERWEVSTLLIRFICIWWLCRWKLRVGALDLFKKTFFYMTSWNLPCIQYIGITKWKSSPQTWRHRQLGKIFGDRFSFRNNGQWRVCQ